MVDTVGYRTVMDDCCLEALTILHMSVYSIVTGIQLSANKPGINPIIVLLLL